MILLRCICGRDNHTPASTDALLKSRAKINARGTKRADTPLHLAAFKGHLETVEYLLKKQADPSIKNVMQRTAADVTQHAGIKAALLTRRPRMVVLGRAARLLQRRRRSLRRRAR